MLVAELLLLGLAVLARRPEPEVDGVAGGQPRAVQAHRAHRAGRGDGGVAGPAALARPRPEQREENRQQDEAVEGAEQDHEEDHLEEGDEEVAGREGEADDAEDGADRALDDREAEGEQAGGDLGVRRAVLHGHVVVADVGGVVHGEADAHDEVDEGHAVQVDAPPGHVAEHAGDDADYGEGDPEGAQRVGDHHEADQHHEARRHQHRLDRLRLDLQVLVDVDEEWMENCHLK